MPLLQSGDKKLVEIAHVVGYESEAAFSVILAGLRHCKCPSGASILVHQTIEADLVGIEQSRLRLQKLPGIGWNVVADWR